MFNIKNFKGFEINYIHKDISIVSVNEDDGFPCEMTFNDDKLFIDTINYLKTILPVLDVVYPKAS